MNVLISAICMLAVFPGTSRAEEVVWQIGEIDRDFHDLAHFSNFHDYLKRFPMDVRFVVGESNAKEHFAWIQPAPADAWSGRRTHPFRIYFDLEDAPNAFHELRIDLVDVHNTLPPVMKVRINDEHVTFALERGTGDPSMAHPEKGVPRTFRFICSPDLLKPEHNEIEITSLEGSYILYDAVTFTRLGQEDLPEMSLTAKPTIFFREIDGQLKQEFDVSIKGALSNKSLTLIILEGDKEIERIELDQATLGVFARPVHIQPAAKIRELTWKAVVGDQELNVQVTQKPQKRWQIFCAPSTHTDIGYTDVQDKVIELHNRNTDLALELIDEFPLYHWNLESSWAAQMWLKDRSPRQHEALYQAARDRRLGIETSYLNMLTGLCSGEELIRNLYYTARLHREHDLPFASHTLTDAPSHVWSVPMILAQSGVRYLSCGINGIRAPLLKQNIHHKSPFWWEGPDGSRILTWFTAGYAQAARIGLKDGMQRMRHAIEADLHQWDHREDYPYDAILLHGAYLDNVQIGRDIAESVTAYSHRYAYPKVILCSNNDFFEYIEANFADAIPVVRGCAGSWWEDGAASSAYETAINRNNHQQVIAAEKIWAAATGGEVPKGVQARFNRIWDNILLYDEHTWGAHNSMREPESDFVRRQFAIKAAYATDAEDWTNRLIDSGLRRLASQVRSSRDSLLVFNPAGQQRTGVVEVKIPRATAIADGNRLVPCQLVKSGALGEVTVAMLAEDVPACGYRTYELLPQGGHLSSSTARFENNVLENEYYRIHFDQESGAISSIVDKQRDVELVDDESPYRFGQGIYAAGGDFTGRNAWWGPDREQLTIHKMNGESFEPAARGPIFTSVRSHAGLHQFEDVVMETILYEHEKRIDFVYRLNKNLTYDREAMYIAFPFVGRKPAFRYEIGAGCVKPEEQHIPGGCRDWFAVQQWVTVHSDDTAVAWSAVDTPLITLCDMTPGEWLDHHDLPNGTIFAYAMNNYWFTNYKAGQDGEFTFRFSVTSDEKIAPDQASHFGASACEPMYATGVHQRRKATIQPASQSFCEIEPANIKLMTAKPADDGRGVIIRLRETAGHDTDVTLNVGWQGMTRASRCDLVERDQQEINLDDGCVRLKLPAFSLVTIRLQK
jgi:hypothetical protein